MITAANHLAQLEDAIPDESAGPAICPACQKTVEGTPINAFDKKWHQACFTCRDCKKIITGFIYADFNGQPVCHVCAKNSCQECKEPLENGKPLTDAMKTGRWHKECFKCRDCRKVITSYMFQDVEGVPLCIACAKKICVACKLPTQPNKGAVSSGDKKWHKECFKCNDCKKVITNFIFIEHEGHVLCQYCTKKRGIAEGVDCHKCGKAISVDGVVDPVSGQQVHVHCLVCSFCKQAVTGGTCVQRGPQVLHKECADATRPAAEGKAAQ